MLRRIFLRYFKSISKSNLDSTHTNVGDATASQYEARISEAVEAGSDLGVKVSKFDPESWTEDEYMERLLFAFKNPVGKAYELPPYGSDIFKLHGRDQEGVVWEMIVQRKDGTNVFKSTCPLGPGPLLREQEKSFF